MILNIDFSGSLQVNAQDISFQYFGEDENKTQFIDGIEWSELSNDERGEYILQSLVQALANAVDVKHEQIDVTIY